MKNEYIIGLFIFLLTLSLAHIVFGLTFKEVEETCPICGTTFKTRRAMSGTVWGRRLDLRPIGPIASPWTIPICPNCRFILFKDKFDNEDVKRFRIFVNSQEYQNLAKNHSPYFLLAKIYESMGMDHLTLAHTYLKASWEVENDQERCDPYLQMSLRNFEKFLLTYDKKDDQWVNAELLCGEIERRLQYFEKAKNRFDRLLELPEFRKDILRRIIFTQIYLIGIKDSKPHEFPLRETKVKE